MKEIKTQVPWTKTLLEDFISEGMLTEDEEFIMRTRCSGWSQVRQLMELNVSTSTVSNIIARCKTKYDNLHFQFLDRFPKRIVSKIEEAMDLLQCMDDCHFKLCK